MLAGRPDDDSYLENAYRVVLLNCRARRWAKFTDKQMEPHRRGDYEQLTTGYLKGNGMRVCRFSQL